MARTSQESPAGDDEGLRSVLGTERLPALEKLISQVLAVWPEHLTFLRQRFDGGTGPQLAFAEETAAKVLAVAGGDLARYAADYRWTCDRMREEEFHFGATGTYRHNSFEEVAAAVYGNPAFMASYTGGLLLSQVLWSNHARVLEFYAHQVLPLVGHDARVLEVGPGHGLLLAMAAERTRVPPVGWDVSRTSVSVTRSALRELGVPAFELHCRDLLEPAEPSGFDLVVASEVLEHLDRPSQALERLLDATSDQGWLFVNVPVNSPAPDHITLWRSPEEVFAFLESGGARIERRAVMPMTGCTEQQARDGDLTLSCAALCRRLP